jgi:hypothetical protein
VTLYIYDAGNDLADPHFNVAGKRFPKDSCADTIEQT